QEMSVFAGGCWMDDVEAVCSAPDAFFLIFSLRDKSLLRAVEEMGETRFTILESLRVYGQERLEQSGAAEEIRQRHALHFLRKAQELYTEIMNSGDAMQRMEIDIDNMRAGMDWAARAEDHETVAAYGDALARFLRRR